MTDRRRIASAIMGGGIAVGILDLADALVFFGLRGVAPIRIPQSIAAGLLGRASFEGGAATAALGVALHFFNAFVIVAAYVLASLRLRPLGRQVLLWGPLYGLAVWCVMNFVVIPLSASTRGAIAWPVAVNGWLIHIFGVGIPAALAARAATRPA